MRKITRIFIPLVGSAAVAGFIAMLMHSHFAVLSPAGTIASKQRQLLLLSTALMLLIVVPVLLLTFLIAWKYRATNKKADYQPEWDHNRGLETLWWGFPLVIVSVLAVIAWSTSHTLDPSRALASNKQPLTIQVVALQWKWLFMYPGQKVATVNYVRFPAGTPVNFQITADAPMNSFWIPKLGGQIYAMSGMTTQLHLMADKPGTFRGSSANISGAGFAAMNFTAQATSQSDFDNWVADTKTSTGYLSLAAYTALARPTVPKQPIHYAAYEPDLYNTVQMKYMAGVMQ